MDGVETEPAPYKKQFGTKTFLIIFPNVSLLWKEKISFI